eukprot:TRINITY_DN2320_c0_g1_i2.p2 TRINITY_DN2320_c0_g1~~TRINITY_DN2320_c0_g1_i2.p2  ORF type:complete len:127 (-),score=21.45 TRINITY_DN2320_c0_g1_i2:614-994(-)
MSSFNHLPKEIVSEILSFIPFCDSDWLNIKLTCRKWNQLGKILFNPSKCGALLRLLHRKASEESIIRLLEDKRIDPSENNSEAFRQACKNEQMRVIEKLMEDKRIDPNNTSITKTVAKSESGSINR